MSLVKVKNGQRRDPIPYALETDWLAWAAGFETLHLKSDLLNFIPPQRVLGVDRARL